MQIKLIVVVVVVEIRKGVRGGGGGAVSKKIFCALQQSVWSKNNGEARAPPVGPPLLFIVHRTHC